jgi:hypothetical protein
MLQGDCVTLIVVGDATAGRAATILGAAGIVIEQEFAASTVSVGCSGPD